MRAAVPVLIYRDRRLYRCSARCDFRCALRIRDKPFGRFRLGCGDRVSSCRLKLHRRHRHGLDRADAGSEFAIVLERHLEEWRLDLRHRLHEMLIGAQLHFRELLEHLRERHRHLRVIGRRHRFDEYFRDLLVDG